MTLGTAKAPTTPRMATRIASPMAILRLIDLAYSACKGSYPLDGIWAPPGADGSAQRNRLDWEVMCHMRGRFVVAGAVLSLVVSAGLVVRILVIDKFGVVVILLPALAGAVLALWRSDSRQLVGLACVLTLATAAVSLIGGAGLLYLPAVALLMAGLSGPPSTPPRPDSA